MPINQLYDTWMRRICELRPGQRITQVRNFVWLMIGIYQSRSVHLSKIAGKIPGPAKLVSVTRRLNRFLDNGDWRGRCQSSPENAPPIRGNTAPAIRGHDVPPRERMQVGKVRVFEAMLKPSVSSSAPPLTGSSVPLSGNWAPG